MVSKTKELKTQQKIYAGKYLHSKTIREKLHGHNMELKEKLKVATDQILELKHYIEMLESRPVLVILS